MLTETKFALYTHSVQNQLHCAILSFIDIEPKLRGYNGILKMNADSKNEHAVLDLTLLHNKCPQLQYYIPDTNKYQDYVKGINSIHTICTVVS